jgi:hypothetical protein
VGIQGSQHVVQGIAPDLPVPVLPGSRILEQAHRVLGIDAVRHVAQTPQVLKVVAMARVEEAVQGLGAEVILPPCRRLDFVSALGVGEGCQAASLEFGGQRPKLNLKVLILAVS